MTETAIERRAMTDEAELEGKDVPVVRIEPVRGWIGLSAREIWEYRELLFFMTWRDVKVRYKQTVLGASWAVIQPLLTMIVFTIFFGRLMGTPSEGVPYPIFSYAALLPWQLFANSLTDSSNSLVGSQNLIKKVYFPRLTIPMATMFVGLVDFSIAFLVLVAMMIYYSIVPGVAVLTLPLFTLLAILTALSVGTWLSAMNVKYRDVRYVVPFLTQLWLFATPVAYPASLVPERWRMLYGLNPMASVVEGFRWALLGTGSAPGPMLWVSVVTVLVLLLGGLFYFRRMEAEFADVV